MADNRYGAGAVIALQSPGQVLQTQSLATRASHCLHLSIWSSNSYNKFFSWDGSRAKRDLSPKLHFSKQQHRVVFVFCFLSVWFHAGLFKEAGVPVKQGLLLPRLCNQDSNRLWEQAAACNYFPTDKRLMGIYCPYWIFCASLSKLQASHPWLTLSSPCASQTFPGLGSQLTGRADPGLGVSTTKHQLWGSQGLGEEITCAVVSAWCWIPKNAAANTWLWG